MKTLVLSLLLISTKAFGWGSTGHRAVGQIAERYLDTKVQIKLLEILDGATLARVSNWPDEIKSEPANYSHTYNWHYTDWKEEDHDHDEANSSGKLLTSINEQVAVLQSSRAGKDVKAFAVKFIVHLIGDLHQPLHVGNGLDQGGNKCKVSFHKKDMNLHALWDEGMIDFTNLSFTEFAQFASQGRTNQEIQAWKLGSVVDWAKESKELRSRIYPQEVNPTSEPVTLKHYCRSDILVTAENTPKLAYEYSYQFVPVMEQRIFQAGLRLAVVLNNALK